MLGSKGLLPQVFTAKAAVSGTSGAVLTKAVPFGLVCRMEVHRERHKGQEEDGNVVNCKALEETTSFKDLQCFDI